MWGNCENCAKMHECRKVCGIMFGGCTIDYVEKDSATARSTPCAEEDEDDIIDEEVSIK